jgi:hypothetical protein
MMQNEKKLQEEKIRKMKYDHLKSFIREINISLKKYEGASNNDEI